MQKIVTNLWFDTEAEEAAKFYTSVFKNSSITHVSHYTDVGPRDKGMVLTVDFELDGQAFTGINGGPEFKFTEATSLLVNCDDQEEIDDLWTKLTADGGSEVACGWLKDKYGVSWQIVPNRINEMMREGDEEQVNRMMAAMLQMKKLDLAELEKAYAAG